MSFLANPCFPTYVSSNSWNPLYGGCLLHQQAAEGACVGGMLAVRLFALGFPQVNPAQEGAAVVVPEWGTSCELHIQHAAKWPGSVLFL